MTTKTWTYAPIVAALVKAEDLLGPSRKWACNNELQKRFIANIFDIMRDNINIPEIVSISDLSVDVVNDFLAKHGFPNIKLSDLGRGSIYTAAIMDLLVEWSSPGETTKVLAGNSVTYDAVILKNKISYFSFRMDCNFYRVARIVTKSGDTVSIIDGIFPEDDLVVMVNSFTANGLNYSTFIPSYGYYDELIFPMIDLDQEVNIRWLNGIATKGDDGYDYVIGQALQQTRLKMNEFGARVESAVAIGLYKSCIVEKKKFVINRPFMMIIERPGIKQSLFVGKLEYDCWKNPGQLK